jgi:hypothetical protein
LVQPASSIQVGSYLHSEVRKTSLLFQVWLQTKPKLDGSACANALKMGVFRLNSRKIQEFRGFSSHPGCIFALNASNLPPIPTNFRGRMTKSLQPL